jgi:hypothetical protein
MCIEGSTNESCCCRQDEGSLTVGEVEGQELNRYRELGSVEDIQKCFHLMLSLIEDYRHYRKAGKLSDIQRCFELTEQVVSELRSYKEVGCLEYVRYLGKKEDCRRFPFLSQNCVGCNSTMCG